MKKCASGLILIFLTACLISCGAKTVTRTKLVYVKPPKEYLQTREIPQIGGTKNRALLRWGLDLREVAKKQNKDKRALQRWRQSIPNRGGEDK
ncbi:MAG: Rz1-like lysis system protein LysC [bacterium]